MDKVTALRSAAKKHPEDYDKDQPEWTFTFFSWGFLRDKKKRKARVACGHAGQKPAEKEPSS